MSKKNIGNAVKSNKKKRIFIYIIVASVKRNKIKRRLRNIVDTAMKEITIKLNYSYLVIAKPTMLNNEFKNIKETLFQEFKKIK